MRGQIGSNALAKWLPSKARIAIATILTAVLATQSIIESW